MGHMITARNPLVQEQDEAAEDGCWMPAAGGSRGEPGAASTLARLTAPSAEMPSGEQLFVLYLSTQATLRVGLSDASKRQRFFLITRQKFEKRKR